jgi:ribulose 1,5-bisphosphate synthetase/thiazole synthase
MMKRRQFVHRLILTSGAVTLGIQCTRPGTTPGGLPSHPPVTGSIGGEGKTVTEPAREIPVVDEVDVLVAGGGPAGIAAAVSAARAGCRTLVVERYNHLGGLWTGGLVLPLLSTHGVDRKQHQVQVIHGIGQEVWDRLKEIDMSIGQVNPVIDPEAAKYVMEVMLKESGVQVYYHSWISNVLVEQDTIKAVILETKSGRVAVRPKMVVDCTGDGDVLNMAGEPFRQMNYEIGLVHRLGNVDRVNKQAQGYRDMDLGGKTPIPSVNWVNMTGGEHLDALDFKLLSELQREHRIRVWEKVQEIRGVPGHEEIFLLDTAPQQGVRMSRILDGMYSLGLKESMTYKRFDDCIGISGAWISVLYDGTRVKWDKRPLWQIPYRALVPRNTHNLLVAGRCFSFHEELFQDARVIGTCLITGHGAGAAAAVSVLKGTSVRDTDVPAIRELLLEQHAYLG